MRVLLWVLFASVVVTGCDCAGDRGSRFRPPGRDTGPVPGIDAGPGTEDAGSCGAGAALCDGMCVDITWDRENCGECGRVCPAGEACSEGSCGTSCGGGRALCGDDCVDLASNPSHCGACDTACASGLFCMEGACRLSCGEFADQCGDICTDVRSDPLNCGDCGIVCPTPPHATPTCTDSMCGYVCDTGWGDCDLLAENGCETSLLDDPLNCGSCDNVCPVPDNATATCEGGVCGFVCNEGFMLTDGMCVAPPTGGCHTGPARVLVYAPGGRGGIDLVPPADVVVTVASEAMWSAMTTADFGQYDIIWLDGNNCSGDASGTYGVAQDTQAVWGPAVRGRTVIMIGDPDYHAESWSTIWYTNNVRWLKQNGRNADGGRTSLFWNWGCTIYNSNTAGMVPGRGTPEMFTSVLGAPIVTDTFNYCFGVTAATGVGHPVTMGMTSYWSCAMHGGFSTYPAGYTVLANGAAGGGGNCALARDPFPCTP